MTGVSRRTFELMVGLVKADEKKKKKPGRRPKLIIEDQLLMVLQYWREYRTYYHIGLDWGLSESAVCRIVYKIENILIKSRKFSLPGKKELWKMSSQEDLFVIDVTESPIERPSKGQKRFFSGKQREHTLKTQFKKAGGRRQRAEGINWKGIVTPPNFLAPKSKIWEGLYTLTPFSRGQRSGDIPSALCLLPSAFPGNNSPKNQSNHLFGA